MSSNFVYIPCVCGSLELALIVSIFFIIGGGKTATFVVPSLMEKGLTIVVSPLIMLMHDQVKTNNTKLNINHHILNLMMFLKASLLHYSF